MPKPAQCFLIGYLLPILNFIVINCFGSSCYSYSDRYNILAQKACAKFCEGTYSEINSSISGDIWTTTLQKSTIERLEAVPRTPTNSLSSIHETESSGKSAIVINILQEHTKSTSPRKDTNLSFSINSTEDSPIGNIEKPRTLVDTKLSNISKKGDIHQTNEPRFSFVTYSTSIPPFQTDKRNKFDHQHKKKEFRSISRKVLKRGKLIDRSGITAGSVSNKIHKDITPKVTTRNRTMNRKETTITEKTFDNKMNETKKHCLAIQTSKTHQTGSGDMNSEEIQTSDLALAKEKEKLERFRKINMKIIEAVSKPNEDKPEEESSMESEDEDCDVESPAEIQNDVGEEEQEAKLNDDALKACLFLNQNFPNYFQHLIKRYQLDVATIDQKELRMKKIDIIRIATESEEKLERLEKMYELWRL